MTVSVGELTWSVTIMGMPYHPHSGEQVRDEVVVFQAAGSDVCCTVVPGSTAPWSLNSPVGDWSIVC
jgi:hypothetical protein